LGLDAVIGSLETGKKADLIIIDTNKPHLTPMYHPVSHLVYAAMGSDVTTSIINGTVVMEEGRIKSMDTEAVIDDVNKIAKEIMAG
jgi:5-methylthioadenosine/S-adenosylhomocysteine deaminase